MKRIIRMLAVVLVVSIALSGMSVFAASRRDAEQNMPRIREYLKVTAQSTPFYKDKPYVNPTNTVIANLVYGDKLILKGTYTDVYGNLWFYAKLAYCPNAPSLVGAYGYIRASYVVDEYE